MQAVQQMDADDSDTTENGRQLSDRRKFAAVLAAELEAVGLLDRTAACWRWCGNPVLQNGMLHLLYDGRLRSGDLVRHRRRACRLRGCLTPAHSLSRTDREGEKTRPRSRWRRQQRAAQRVEWRQRVEHKREYYNALRRQSRRRNREAQRRVWHAWWLRRRAQQQATGGRQSPAAPHPRILTKNPRKLASKPDTQGRTPAHDIE